MAQSPAATAFVDALNQAWQQQDWPTLAEMYHTNAVLLPPDLGDSLLGRDAILQTYRDFASQATLHRFAVTDLQTHSFAHCEVLHCAFEADYSVAGNRSQDDGTEIYVTELNNLGRRVIVWRQQIIHSARSVDP